jgi:hypothetical protein
MEMDKVTEKTLGMIHKLLKDKTQFDDWYSMPYSSNDDDRVDVHIEYKIKKVLLKKNSNDPNHLFTATIIIQPTKVVLGVDDDWEEGFKQHDISEHMWDLLAEEVIEDIETILPHVYIIPEFDFTKINT